MKPFFFNTPIIPTEFRFPEAYEHMLLNDAWPKLDPWAPLALDMPNSLMYYSSMLLKFKNAPLIPFAMICDETGFCNDGYVVLACFDGSDLSGDPIVRIYDYGSPKDTPWDNLSYPNFLAWLADAKKESDQHLLYLREIEDEAD
ncbi:hypothetical protein LIN78_05125 [Leeia sp. TBRC 13508]|uniref:SMI1/KNR4 family protein n=1 Tax=Leeia speluncae TaxID=2884804 RepID=A0ABS8D427_9NEIS|nr:hypothetical protein [Leeia speluncae]MCB6182929.1 hypothetical protein [Leeia speluncae]